MALWGLIVLSALLAVDAKLVTDYPVNSQLPPVARVSQPFEYTFSENTFGGVDANTVYSLSNAPSWLRVDSGRRTFSGTPKKDDEGTAEFVLVASNGPESAGMVVTFIVTKDDGPKLGKPLLPQLEHTGATSAPSTILIHSGDSFSIAFDPDTFTNTRPSTVYYGTSPNNAPLPSWIGFDQSNLQFSGTAPNIGPQTFSFNLVASDVAGFGAASASFDITISPHILSFNESVRTFFVSGGKEFNSPRFDDALALDGRKPVPADLIGIKIESPDWLKLDKESISLSGNPPVGGKDENVTISVRDRYQNEAKLLITLQYSHFFRGVKGCNAVIGEYFTFVFDNTVLANDSFQLEVDLRNNLPWLHYNSDNKTLYGQVPSDISPGESSIKLTARNGTAQDTRNFTINAVEGTSPHTFDSGGGDIHGRKAGIIAAAVVVPVVFVMSFLFLFYCWCRKRRIALRDDSFAPSEKIPPLGLKTSKLPHCEPFEDMAQGSPPQIVRSPSPISKPPRLELIPLWNNQSFPRRRANTCVNQGRCCYKLHDWMGFRTTQKTLKHTRKRKLKMHTRSPNAYRSKAAHLHSMQSSRSKRLSKRSSGISSIASGLPVRLSGAGHGAGGFGPPGHGVVRVSWQNTRTSFQSDESGVGNLAPLFPRPPRDRDSPEYPKRMSLRTVEPDNLTISESDSLDVFVHSRAKHRNSSNPLFAGQLSRRTSTGLRALERARSNASRTDTINSSKYVEDNRESIRDRPWSTAMSASIYTDDNRRSAYLESLSEESLNMQPVAPIGKGPSQSSLAQKYSETLPRFYSELSLSSRRRAEASLPESGSGNFQALTEEQGIQAGRRDSLQSNSYLQDGMDGGTPIPAPVRKSSSFSTAAFDGKIRRVSLIRLAERDVNGRRGLSRDLNSSIKSDIAFV
ncbi:putative transmembrane glycoprotein [Aspergillus tanneri]|uniref:Dystroglycan-type cadherin-like domain-containing protein n=1 Tax=Aspergillus tanneri TaxID=1220188 RepID=A0A5M9NCE7_9EURO|nr:uncharacterized protein ATNIH1004_001111 [Aspergillus tanneri]KAA8652207.1 hypothetical protein ATNIH1004_001111 [Aspergillus tanneri]